MTLFRRVVPRPRRLEFPGAAWHVTNRGVEQRSIYADDFDRQHFLQLLEQIIGEYRWQLRTYTLMSNHYHLYLRTPQANLSLGMKDLDGFYAESFNKRHRRVGHLFQGRFKSKLVDSETYLLSLARYIVLNPVRAGLVATPDEWRWSSYRATAGLAAVPPWLDHGPILDAFNADDWTKAMHGYREFVAAGIGRDVSPWRNLVEGMFLGGKEFVEEVRSKVNVTKKDSSLLQRAMSVTSSYDQTPCTIDFIRRALESIGVVSAWPPPPGSNARVLLACLAARYARCSRAEIGRLLGITGQGALHLIRESEGLASSDARFAQQILEFELLLTGVRP